MRFAFHTVKQIALCLLLLPVFWCPAHAADGGKAKPSFRQASGRAPESAATSSPAASGQTPQNLRKPAAATGQSLEAEQAAGEAKPRDNWVKMEPGGRQAYVGIHGGTAPLSLVCSTDGVLFAFTGQTGNDFTHVLRGGNASRASANGTRHPGQNASGNGHTPEAVTDTRTVPEQTLRAVTESSLAAAESQAALPQDAENPVAAQFSEPAVPAGSLVVAAPASAGYATPVSPQPETGPASDAKTAFATAKAENSGVGATVVQAVSPPVRPSASQAGSPAPEGRRKEPGEAAAAEASAPDNAPGREKPLSPSNSADMVFASGELASSIKDAPEFLPFGLTPPADAVNDGPVDSQSPVPARQSVPGHRPLKLRSYQQVLRHSGSV